MNPLGVLTRPRATLAGAADHPSLRLGALVVLLSGVACLAAEAAGAAISGAGAGAVILSAVTPLLLMVFWLVSGLLVGAGARLMGWDPQRRRLLAVTGLTFPALIAYALIGLVQAGSPRVGGPAISIAAGLLALPVVAWFVALNAMAVASVYQGSTMAAVAIALLPYAALSGALLLLILVVSLLHTIGAV